MDVSIVIPTKNAGTLFNKVLASIFNQNTELQYEVICVDSGSTDNTIEIIKSFPVKLYQIAPQEFGHGKTRNYGAAQGTGEFIVFITQDALPANEYWLQRLVEAMGKDEKIAGGFGIHYPYEGCNLLDQRDITLHFRGFGCDRTIYFMQDLNRYENEEGYRHLLAYFSDNNSCLRRSVWEKIPYDDVNFAEDQIWAKKIIELGYKKVYTPFAAVYHSHNYKLSTYFQRYFDEYKGVYQVHQYKILPSPVLIIPAAIKHILSDIKYIKSLNELSLKKKIYWIYYSTFRNFSRYIAGYLGSNYHNYNSNIQQWLDRKISQQYKQVKGV